jgi:hypothetical protein
MTHHLNFLFGLERKLADAVFAAGRMTPAGFRCAAKEVLPPEIYDKWAEQLPSAHYRGWKGLEEAARNLHYQASRIFHGDAEAIRAAEDAANAIYGLIPLIKGPRKRPRALHDREGIHWPLQAVLAAGPIGQGHLAAARVLRAASAQDSRISTSAATEIRP